MGDTRKEGRHYDSGLNYLGRTDKEGRHYDSGLNYLGYTDKDGRHYDSGLHYLGHTDKEGRHYDSGLHYLGYTDKEGRHFDNRNNYLGRTVYDDGTSVGDTVKAAIIFTGICIAFIILAEIGEALENFMETVGQVLPYVLIVLGVLCGLWILKQILFQDGIFNKKVALGLLIIMAGIMIGIMGIGIIQRQEALKDISKGDYEQACERLYDLRFLPYVNSVIKKNNLETSTMYGRYRVAKSHIKPGSYYAAMVELHKLGDYRDSIKCFEDTVKKYLSGRSNRDDGGFLKIDDEFKSASINTEGGFFLETEKYTIGKIYHAGFDGTGFFSIDFLSGSGKYRKTEDFIVTNISEYGFGGIFKGEYASYKFPARLH